MSRHAYSGGQLVRIVAIEMESAKNNFSSSVPVRALVFDLGGVILPIDYDKTRRELLSLAGKTPSLYFSQIEQHPIFDALETGKISEKNFFNEIRNLLGSEAEDRQIENAWNAMLGKLPPQRITFLEKLGTRIPLYLLSNTNSIHKRAFVNQANEAVGYSRFEKVFRKTYFSHEVGLRKPDREIYIQLAAEIRMNPREIWFVDDSKKNVEGAKKSGYQTYWLKPGEKIEHQSFLLSLLDDTNAY